ncbi:YlaH-like protein [Priestia endophytica DSM 13796]|jgi:CHASE2 domain-containing sensor protein|nr:YlaH-like protein [Priestia endophytica DSM 13796]
MMGVSERLQFFAKLFKVDENPEAGMWLLYFTILLLAVVVYNLGFARKLPIIKNVIIYALLAFGCTILTFFGAFLPVAEGLLIAVLVLGAYKVRLHQAKKNEQM